MLKAEEGVVLIDEIENGLHYSLQVIPWETIFETIKVEDIVTSIRKLQIPRRTS